MCRIIENSQDELNEEERLQMTLGLVKGQSFTFGIEKIHDGRMIAHDVFFYEWIHATNPSGSSAKGGVTLNAVFQELEMAGQVMEGGHEEACRNLIQPPTPNAWEVRNHSHIGGNSTLLIRLRGSEGDFWS